MDWRYFPKESPLATTAKPAKPFVYASGAVSMTLHHGARDAIQRHRTRGWSIDISTAILLSVAAAEAGINEIGTYGPALGLPPGFKVPGTLREAWRRVTKALTGRAVDETTRLWEDFEILIKLRNRIVHFEWCGDPPEWMEEFRDRGLT